MMFPTHLFLKAFTSLPAGRPLLEANSRHSLAVWAYIRSNELCLAALVSVSQAAAWLKREFIFISDNFKRALSESRLNIDVTLYMVILLVPSSSTAGRLPRETQERKISESSGSTEFNEHVAQPLRELELILLKLKTQLKFCLVGIFVTILGYLFIRSQSECCEFPFQESSCAIKNSLPPMMTNCSTLAGEVEGFLDILQTKISNLKNAVKMPSLADRQKTFEVTKVEIRRLINEHSANLAAFGAIKREDKRRKEFEEVVSDGYFVLIPFAFYRGIYLWMLIGAIHGTRISKRSYLAKLKDLPDEEGENLQNARLKKLKRRIPIFYLATLTCVLMELGFYAAFLAGQYYVGSCPVYIFLRKTGRSEMKSRNRYIHFVKSFADYPAFAEELQPMLDVLLTKLNKSMQSPILEVRQLGWDYEEGAIDRAFIHHIRLKKYHVDRNTMPRRISHAPQASKEPSFIILFIGFFLNISSLRCRLSRDTRERKTSEVSGSTEFNEYVAQPLRELELILLKLKTQLILCLIGILLTILGYLFIRSRSLCCEFPFQESSCAVKSSLPSMTTNYSTLAGEVDGFLAALQIKISNIETAVQMPLITDRKNVFEVTKVGIRELIQDHSTNLAAFGAIKREDERIEELEVALSDGYSVLGPFVFFGGIFLWILLVIVFGTRISKHSYLAKLKELPEEDSENLQNVRLKKLKIRIPIFYLATLICIMVQLGLYITFIAGQYYAGSCPVYYRIETISQGSKEKEKRTCPSPFPTIPSLPMNW
ncbi:hypothetical protein Ddc_20869 [Ditylenchus destructor]|nr:hypothetical protein Ddc_20869 [Ditylenchus destructor]